jgi:tetratricopeptide (TPR) repeat protein
MGTTENNSATEASDAAASTVDFQEMGTSAAGVDPVGVASLAFSSAIADPGVAQELGGFLHEQRELASKHRIVADKQSELLGHRLERAGLEKEHIEAQNHHLHLQHIHDKLRLVLDAGLACFGVALALLLVWAVWTAIQSKSVLVDAFTVPPSFEAPKWGALHLHWGEALDKLGRHTQALEKYRAALELALSDPDRQIAALHAAIESR